MLQCQIAARKYASADYQAELRHGVICSMSRKGDCSDNAIAESFFATVKTELVYLIKFKHTKRQSAIWDFIACFYNQRRRYLSPVQFENLFVQEMREAA